MNAPDPSHDRIHRLPASAGAEWLVEGFRLLARAPLGLGTLGLIFGALGLVANLAARSGAGTPALMLQLAFVLIGPLLLAGLIFAAREVDLGRAATPSQLLVGLQGDASRRLLATLLPQVVAVVILIALLLVLVGPAQLEALNTALQKAQGQAQPDPALFEGLAVGRMFLWLVLAALVAVLAGFFNFTAIPEMLFNGRGAWAAMRQSFRACLRNLPAMLLFFVLLLVSALVLNIGAMLVGAIVGAVLGQVAMMIAMQLVVMAVLMPVVTAAMYVAWKQMHGAAAASQAPPLPPAHFEA